MVNIGREKKKLKGFTILEVLISLSILVITLMVLYNSFSTSLFVLSTTKNLWKAISFAQIELLKTERAAITPNIQISSGEFQIEHPMRDFRWERVIKDTYPLPNIKIRQVKYKLFWEEGNKQYSYDSEIYVKTN